MRCLYGTDASSHARIVLSISRGGSVNEVDLDSRRWDYGMLIEKHETYRGGRHIFMHS